MTEPERRVVNHAMKILEQSQDDEARALAVKLLEQGTKVPLQKVQFYAAYCNGLRDGYSRIFDLIQGGGWLAKVSKKEMPYFEAEKKLVESCIDACYDYHIWESMILGTRIKNYPKVVSYWLARLFL